MTQLEALIQAQRAKPEVRYAAHRNGKIIGGFDERLNRFVAVACLMYGAWESVGAEVIIDGKPTHKAGDWIEFEQGWNALIRELEAELDYRQSDPGSTLYNSARIDGLRATLKTIGTCRQGKSERSSNPGRLDPETNLKLREIADQLYAMIRTNPEDHPDSFRQRSIRPSDTEEGR